MDCRYKEAHLVLNWHKRAKKFLLQGRGLTWQQHRKKSKPWKQTSSMEIDLIVY